MGRAVPEGGPAPARFSPDRAQGVSDGVEPAGGGQAQVVDVQFAAPASTSARHCRGEVAGVGRFGRQNQHVRANPGVRRGRAHRPHGGGALLRSPQQATTAVTWAMRGHSWLRRRAAVGDKGARGPRIRRGMERNPGVVPDVRNSCEALHPAAPPWRPTGRPAAAGNPAAPGAVSGVASWIVRLQDRLPDPVPVVASTRQSAGFVGGTAGCAEAQGQERLHPRGNTPRRRFFHAGSGGRSPEGPPPQGPTRRAGRAASTCATSVAAYLRTCGCDGHRA